MTKRVAVIGAGNSKFGKRKDLTIRELAHEAAREAFADADLEPKDIEASVISVAGEEFAGQGSPAAVISDYIGLAEKPTQRVEAACASGSTGVRTAWAMIAAGYFDLMMVVGVEKMTAVSTAEATRLMACAGDTKWEYPLGISFPGFYALMATAHMAEYGTTREQLSMVSVKNHYYGSLNPKAHLQKQVTLEEAMKSHMIAAPLNLYDCSLISDGAAAIILASEDVARKLTDTPIWIKGLGWGSDTMLINERKSLTSLAGARRAAQMAYKMAGVTSNDIDVAEVHDCFTIAEIIAYEDLGFAEPGKGGQLIQDEQTYIGGKIPVNVDGGLKAKGHPVGATGVSQAAEITKQLRGDVEPKRQVDGATIGLQHNVGQSGQFVNVIIYGRD